MDKELFTKQLEIIENPNLKKSLEIVYNVGVVCNT